MSKLFFIIGLRRSGTSILRTIMLRHSDVSYIEFEPHDLWAAVELSHFDRIRKDNKTDDWIRYEIDGFSHAGSMEKHYGVKFALNPGVKALEWVWLARTFPEAKFIFILRNTQSTWNSYYDQDKNSIRGAIDKRAYDILSDSLKGNFRNYVANNPDKSCIVNYEKMLANPDQELWRVWELLNIKPLTGLKPLMKKPRF